MISNLADGFGGNNGVYLPIKYLLPMLEQRDSRWKTSGGCFHPDFDTEKPFVG